MTNIVENSDDTLIGYSSFEIFGQAFTYHGKACFVADTPESLSSFLANSSLSAGEYEIVLVYLSDILTDYGLSNGEYALEPDALLRFKKEADSLGIKYTVAPVETVSDEKPDVFIIHVNQLNRESGEIEPIQDIIENFSVFDGFYKREAVDAAIEYKDEIIPLLINVLERIIASPDEYAANEDYYAHVYAVMLLGYFREEKALKVIIETLSLPESVVEDLFGDLLYENLPAILLRTCGGSFDQIKSLALDRSAGNDSRCTALNSMVTATLSGVLDSNETLAFFCSLFTGKEAEAHSDFWSHLAVCVNSLYPENENVMETIKGAFDSGLIDPGIISLQDFESALGQEKEVFLEQQRMVYNRNPLDDIHESMSWWACFDQENDSPRISSSPGKKQRNTKPDKKKKKTKKMRKASKKKNRK